jgi:hypothetical protein
MACSRRNNDIETGMGSIELDDTRRHSEIDINDIRKNRESSLAKKVAVIYIINNIFY